ncbi:MAG: helix-turn-helix domain-containing protein [Candidatus Hodarchaeota archaeon]
MVTEVYEKLGLSPKEGKIYTILVSRLVRTKEEIKLLAEELAPEVDEIIEKLEEKKFIRTIPGRIPQYSALVPHVAISPGLDDQIDATTTYYYNEINSLWEKGQASLQSIIDQIQDGAQQLSNFENKINSILKGFIKQINETFETEKLKVQEEIDEKNKTNTNTLEICDLSFHQTIRSRTTKTLEELQSKIDELRSNFQEKLDNQIHKSTSEKANEIVLNYENWISHYLTIIDSTFPIAENQKDEQLTTSNEHVSDLSTTFEKITLNFSRQLPKLIEEFSAQNTDDFNIFNRTIKSEFNKIKTKLQEIQNEAERRLSKRVSLGKSGFQDISSSVDLALEEINSSQKNIDNHIEKIIGNFSESNTSLIGNINSSLNRQNFEFNNLLETIRSDLSETIVQFYELLISNLKLISENLQISSQQQNKTLNLQINQMVDTLVKNNEELYSDVNKTLNEFLERLQTEIETISNQFVENIWGCLADISNILTVAGNSYSNLINDRLSSIFSSVDSEIREVTTPLEESTTNLMQEINSKLTTVQNSITSDFQQSIDSIPRNISINLAQGRNLIKSLSEINNLAQEIPIGSIEKTYFQIKTSEDIKRTLEAMLTRTKSTIQIIIPTMALLPIETIKKITRPRIQILTIPDSSESVEILKNLNNIQLKSFGELENIYAAARDGTEEIIVGSGKGDKISFIVTTDEDLAGVMKEIILDYWPRGRAV